MSEQLEALERRVRRVEDELAIQRLLASYGPLVDAGAADDAASLWAEDGEYDVAGWHMRSRDDVRDMVSSSAHQGLVARGCAHFAGPVVVTLDGDRAVAVCESLLVRRREDEYVVWRAGVHHLTLRRGGDNPHGWEIVTRTTRVLDGDELARRLLHDGALGRTAPPSGT